MSVFVEFRDIVDFPGYQVGSDGSVRKHYWGEVYIYLKPVPKSAGYRAATLVKDGVQKQFNIHTLVAEAFHGPCPDGLICCHDNGVPFDNRARNLYWGTYTDNEADKRRHGRTMLGEKNHAAKLTEPQAREVKRLISENVPTPRIAEMFGVTTQAIHLIKKGRNWAWLP